MGRQLPGLRDGRTFPNSHARVTMPAMDRLEKLALLAAAAMAGTYAATVVVRKSRHYDVRGRVALVTGGSRGLGLEIARQLVDAGAKVAICARDEAELRESADDLRGRGGEVFAMTADVTSDADVAALVEAVRGEFGPIDVLVNNAAVIQVGPASQMTREDYDLALETTVRGPLRTILAVAPEMRRRRSGRIVNIASIGGLMPVPHLAPYCTAKHALVGLGTSLRGDLAKDGVYLTTVCPGLVRTGSPPHALFKGDAEAEYQWFASADNVPGLTISTPDMAAAAIRGLVNGDALVVSPWHTKLQASLYGLTQGIGTELMALMGKLLPTATGKPRPAVAGSQVRTPLPGPLESYQSDAAEKFNQR